MSTYSKPAFVYFDLGNVLLNFDHQIACNNLAKLCDRDPEVIRQLVFNSDLQERYEAGQVTTREFHAEFCDSLEVSVGIEEVCRAASEIFWVNGSAIPIVAQLYRDGTRFGILSNTCEAHWNYLFDGRYRFLNALFQKFALSFELGCAKPGMDIYGKAAEIAGFAPEEIFFVDDRPENVTGAKEAGFDAVLFEGGHSLARELVKRGLLPGI